MLYCPWTSGFCRWNTYHHSITQKHKYNGFPKDLLWILQRKKTPIANIITALADPLKKCLFASPSIAFEFYAWRFAILNQFIFKFSNGKRNECLDMDRYCKNEQIVSFFELRTIPFARFCGWLTESIINLFYHQNYKTGIKRVHQFWI